MHRTGAADAPATATTAAAPALVSPSLYFTLLPEFNIPEAQLIVLPGVRWVNVKHKNTLQGA